MERKKSSANWVIGVILKEMTSNSYHWFTDSYILSVGEIAPYKGLWKTDLIFLGSLLCNFYHNSLCKFLFWLMNHSGQLSVLIQRSCQYPGKFWVFPFPQCTVNSPKVPLGKPLSKIHCANLHRRCRVLFQEEPTSVLQYFLNLWIDSSLQAG